MTTTFKGAAIGLAAVLLLGLLALSPVGIADAHGEGTEQEEVEPDRPTPEEHAEANLQRREERAADLAAELGVETQAVLDAMRAVFADRLAEKVEEGRLTSEEADAILQRYDEGFGHFGLGFGPGRRHWHGPGFHGPRPDAAPDDAADGEDVS